MDTCDKELSEEALLKEIMAYDFAAYDLVLYLDTHPECKKATKLWQEYSNKGKKLKDDYQKLFGPLSSDFPCGRFRWIERAMAMGKGVLEYVAL